MISELGRPTSDDSVNANPHVLVVARGGGSAAHPGLVDGLKNLIAEGALRGAAIAAFGEIGGQDQEHAWGTIINHVNRQRTEFVVLHHFHSERLNSPAPAIDRLKALPSRPVVAVTNGDPFFNGFFRPSFPKMFVEALRAADVGFSTSMGVSAEYLRRRGAGRLALLPMGACQARFGASVGRSFARPEFRVVFIGSNNRSKNPAHSYYWFARQREALVRSLSTRFGSRFAVFGHNWEGVDGWQGPVPFERQLEACQRGEVVVGGVPFSPARYYLSNRPFNQILSGVPFVDLGVEGVETILRDGEHWHLAASVEEVAEVCDSVLSKPLEERREMGQEAARFVLDNHSDAERVRSLLATLGGLRTSIIDRIAPPPPDLRFFLSEADVAREAEFATLGW